MKSIKRLSTHRSTSYFRVSTKGSPSTSRSPSPASTSTNVNVNHAGSTTGTGTSSEEDLDLRTNLEKELFDLVNSHQIQNVQNFLRANRNVNINTRDTEGLSILHHAVINNDEEMVDILLKDNYEIHVYDALLQAVKDNSIPMVIKLMKWKESMRSKTKKVVTALFTPKPKAKLDGTEYYGDDITPLLMAAICGHYELIDLLYGKGERLLVPHPPHCTCKECGQPSADLKKSNGRIHLLKGLANPTYLAFMAGVVPEKKKYNDPILESFTLAQTLKQWISVEPEFKAEYEEILENIQKFPVELLSHCRDAEETSILLRQEDGYTGVSSPYPRLILAIDYEQKEFVANTNAQDALYQEWIGETWITTTVLENIRKKIFLILSTIFAPLISFCLAFTLCCVKDLWVVKYLTSPKRRCYSSIASYVYFLGVLFYMNSAEKGKAHLGPPSHYLPWVVGVFVISHFLSFLKHFFMSPKHFLSQGWNLFELFGIIFFFASIGLWIASWHRVKSLGTIKAGKTQHTYFRDKLECDDVLLWSEICTGIASTIAGLRLLRWVILHYVLGPLQIALGKMRNDIFLFAFIFAIIIISFALGVQHLYRPYKKYTTDCIFCDFPSSVETLFYALFTMASADSPKVPMIPVGNTGTMNHHPLTESVGKIIFVVHHILCVTFLLNMLVGMMSSTYSSITDNVTVEWKYGRAKLWLYYIQDGILITPLNICPTLCLYNFFNWLIACCSKTNRRLASCNLAHCFFVAKEEDQQNQKDIDRKYPLLIRRLLQRYFRSRSSIASEEVPVADDIKQVQKQVLELRALTTMTLDLHSNPNSGTRINNITTEEGGGGHHHVPEHGHHVHKTNHATNNASAPIVNKPPSPTNITIVQPPKPEHVGPLIASTFPTPHDATAVQNVTTTTTTLTLSNKKHSGI